MIKAIQKFVGTLEYATVLFVLKRWQLFNSPSSQNRYFSFEALLETQSHVPIQTIVV